MGPGVDAELQDRPSDLDSAAQRAGRCDPEDERAFEALALELRSEEAWGDLEALFRRRLAAASLASRPCDRAALLIQRGRLLEGPLEDPDAAVQCYREAATANLAAREPLRLLRRHYRARGSFDMVLQIGEAELSRATDPGERAQLLEELADVWEQELHDLEQADLLRERGRREIEPLTHPMPGTPTPDDDTIGAHSPAAAPEPPAQQAWLLAARGDVPAAVELLTRTLEREPENVQAIDMMITVLEGTERHTDTASWLERRADLATDPGTRAAVLCRLGAVRELQLGDPMGAGMAYERALQAQPDAQGVRGALARIHRATEAWPKLRGLLEQTILEESGDERAAALAELAVLLEGPFDDAAAALQTWQALLADRPGDRRAMEHAGRLRGSLERAAAASDASRPEQGEPRAVRILAVLERKLEHREREGAGESEEALELRMRIAELRGTALGDPGSAVAVLQPVLDDEETLLRVADLLANLYDAEDRLDTLAELGARVASLTDDPDGRADWLRRAANAAHRGGLTELAAECYRRLLEERPHDREAAARLRELYPLLGATGELVSLLRDEIARSEGERERALHLELASLLEESLGDAKGALLHAARALEIDPSDETVLERALTLAGVAGDDLTQLDVLDHAVAAAGAPPLRAALMARRAAHLADALGWSQEAREGFEAARALDPDSAAKLPAQRHPDG
jgi:tetratricopeptide (TPR) repeat protein